MLPTGSPVYSLLFLAALGVSLIWWLRRTRDDPGLTVLFASALGGAAIGAKLVYFAAEGWLHWHEPDRWMHWAAGKTVLGALIGGYAGVETAKHFLRCGRVTGDLFAACVPVSIILGRVGCLVNGCCPGRACGEHWYALRGSDGVPRWPAVPAEIAFNFAMFALFFILRKRRLLTGQHFHLYFISYGLFRFVHEFVRDTPRLAGPLSGYALAALFMAGLGTVQFFRRTQQQRRSLPPHSPVIPPV